MLNHRIAYLVSQYPAISHTFILREVRALRQLGFDLSVASINGPDRTDTQLTSEELDEKERTYYIKAQGMLGAARAHLSCLLRSPAAYLRGALFALRLGRLDLNKTLYCFFYFVEAVILGRWMRRQGLKALHVHFATPASTVALILSKVYSITYSITVHGPDEFYHVDTYYLKEKIESASFVCCIGLYARSQLMRISSPEHWSKLEISPLGVDLDQFTPSAQEKDEGPFEVLCVGRLVPAKGQHVLLEAVRRLRADGRNIRLRFVGDGPDRKSLQELASKWDREGCVQFDGAVNQDGIRQRYAQADVFALASFAEGIPVVLMEAMAMEIPCVSTYITGIPELIRNEKDGLLVAPSSVEQLQEALINLMDDPDLRQRLGKAGRRRVQDKYNLRPNITRLAEIFGRRLEALQKS